MRKKLKSRITAWACLAAIAGTNIFGNASSIAYAAEDEGYPHRFITGECNHNCLDSWECMAVLDPDELNDEVAIGIQKEEEAASKEEAKQQKKEEAESIRQESKEEAQENKPLEQKGDSSIKEGGESTEGKDADVVSENENTENRDEKDAEAGEAEKEADADIKDEKKDAEVKDDVAEDKGSENHRAAENKAIISENSGGARGGTTEAENNGDAGNGTPEGENRGEAVDGTAEAGNNGEIVDGTAAAGNNGEAVDGTTAAGNNGETGGSTAVDKNGEGSIIDGSAPVLGTEESNAESTAPTVPAPTVPAETIPEIGNIATATPSEAEPESQPEQTQPSIATPSEVMPEETEESEAETEEETQPEVLIGRNCVHVHDDTCGYYAYRTKFSTRTDDVVVKATMIAPTADALPAGAHIVAEKVEDEGQLEEIAGMLSDEGTDSGEIGTDQFQAYDIWFEYGGEKYEPEEGAKVTVDLSYRKPVEAAGIAGEEADISDMKVLHIKDGTEVEDVTKEIVQSQDGKVKKATFETESFSIFVLTSVQTVVENSYKFMGHDESGSVSFTAVTDSSAFELPEGAIRELTVDVAEKGAETDAESKWGKMANALIVQGIDTTGAVYYDIGFSPEGSEGELIRTEDGIFALDINYTPGSELPFDDLADGSAKLNAYRITSEGTVVPVDDNIMVDVNYIGLKDVEGLGGVVITTKPAAVRGDVFDENNYSIEYILSHFLVFAKGNLTVSNHLTGGAVAVGDNLRFANKHGSLGSWSGGCPSEPSYVGKNFSRDGNATWGMDLGSSGPTIYLGFPETNYNGAFMAALSNTNWPNFKFKYNSPDYMNMNKAFIELQRQANIYGDLDYTNNSSQNNLLSGDTYVFDKDSGGIPGSITVKGAFSRSPTIIVLKGSGFAFPTTYIEDEDGNNINDATYERYSGFNVVYILPDYTGELSYTRSTDFYGHLVAPNANVVLGWTDGNNYGGNINGTVIANSVTSNVFEHHYWPYNGGDLPKPESANCSLQLTAHKILNDSTGTAVSSIDKTFYFVAMDESRETIAEGTNDANGEINFYPFFSYDEADAGGNFVYTVKELDDNQSGITYDSSSYQVTVSVEKSEGDGLKAEISSIYKLDPETGEPVVDLLEGIEFVNAYKANVPVSAQISLGGTKIMQGRPFQEGDSFDFIITDITNPDSPTAVSEYTLTPSAEELQTTPNQLSFTFKDLKYESLEDVGEHRYLIKETAGADSGMTYDTSQWKMTVDVSYNAESNALTASVTKLEKTLVGENEPDSQKQGLTNPVVEFTNEFNPAQIQFKLECKKIMEGRPFQSGDSFQFVAVQIMDGDGTEKKIGEAEVNISDGDERIGTYEAEFNLALEPYTRDDIGQTYTYRITETQGSAANLNYSSKVYTAVVEVGYDESTSELTASVVYKDITGDIETVDQPVFTNTYTPAPPTPPTPPTPPDRPTTPPGGGSDGSTSGGGTSSRVGRSAANVSQIDDTPVPLAEGIVPETTTWEILDEDVPLAALPKTGEKRSMAAAYMMVVSLLGIIGVGVTRRREEK